MGPDPRLIPLRGVHKLKHKVQWSGMNWSVILSSEQAVFMSVGERGFSGNIYKSGGIRGKLLCLDPRSFPFLK